MSKIFSRFLKSYPPASRKSWRFINAKFFRVFLKFVYVRISEHFLSVFQKLFQNFSNIFQNFIKLPRNFFAVSLHVFRIFLVLIGTVPLISPQLLNKSLKFSGNFRKIFRYSQNYFKMSEEFFQNFWKNISRFLRRIRINAGFPRSFFATCLSLTFLSAFPTLS